MELKDRIKQARKHARLTQKELSKKIGITQPSLSELETGKSLSTSYIASIARACGVDPFWLESGQSKITSNAVSSQIKEESAYYQVEETNPMLLTHPDMLAITTWDDSTPIAEDETEVPFLREIELAAGSGKYAIEESYTRTKLRFGRSTLRNRELIQRILSA